MIRRRAPRLAGRGSRGLFLSFAVAVRIPYTMPTLRPPELPQFRHLLLTLEPAAAILAAATPSLGNGLGGGLPSPSIDGPPSLSGPPYVATVAINRPERANALDRQLIFDLAAAFDALGRRDDIGAVVLTSFPGSRHFCAGVDLNSFSGLVSAGGGRECASEPSSSGGGDGGDGGDSRRGRGGGGGTGGGGGGPAGLRDVARAGVVLQREIAALQAAISRCVCMRAEGRATHIYKHMCSLAMRGAASSLLPSPVRI